MHFHQIPSFDRFLIMRDYYKAGFKPLETFQAFIGVKFLSYEEQFRNADGLLVRATTTCNDKVMWFIDGGSYTHKGERFGFVYSDIYS